MSFRFDINAMRALAVLAVVIFHLNPSYLQGGFAGVDVFFVISGYLMTSIIFKSHKLNSWSLWAFYLARAMRIIPALLFLSIILLLLGWFLLIGNDYSILNTHVFDSLLFISNITYWQAAGYFNASSKENWLLHTWSLSVEWQFYLLYPILISVLLKCFSVKFTKRIILITIIPLAILAFYLSSHSPSASFFLFPTRAWEMLAGGLVFLYPIKLSDQYKNVFSNIGVLVVTGSYFFIDESFAWPGIYTLLPVLGSVLIIASNDQTSIFSRNTTFQYVGNLSYSIYLWHWPIIVYFNFFGSPFNNDIYTLLFSIILISIFSLFSYYLVEKSKLIKKTFLYLFLPFLVVIVFSKFLENDIADINTKRSINESSRSDFINYYSNKLNNLNEDYWLNCNVYNNSLNNKGLFINENCFIKGSELFLWGDSHAESFSYGLRTLLLDNRTINQATSSACKPSLYESNLKGQMKKACDFSNELALEKIELLKPKIVFIAQANSHERTDWDEIYDRLIGLGVKSIYLIGPLPQWSPTLPKAIAYRHWNSFMDTIEDSNMDTIEDSNMDEGIIETNDVLTASNFKMEFINVFDFLCKPGVQYYKCKVRNDGDLFTIDYGHLGRAGSIFIVEHKLLPLIKTKR